MDEGLNENDLEERRYAMLHYVDQTQANVKATGESEPVKIVENVHQSTIRRYWHTSADYNPPPNKYQKINTPKAPTPVARTENTSAPPKPKEEKNASPPPTADLSLFQSSPRIIQKTIEILDTFEVDNPKVILESSDEDEVIEVALPPKPTITIESSDEDDVCIVSKQATPSKDKEKEAPKRHVDRDSASPVPSVVSSVSDDFIRGDCIAMNISSRHTDNHTFDFSLHGSDLLGQTTPAKKKKKKKAKEITTSTPVAVPSTTENTDACFATPKSKAKHKKQKSKIIAPGKEVPSIDVYDSDSNQFVITATKQNSYTVTDKSLPSADVYDSDSNQSEIVKEIVPSKPNVSKDPDSSDNSISATNVLQTSTPKTTKSVNNKSLNVTADSVVDLTDNDFITLDKTGFTEHIVMANVTGFTESMDYGDDSMDTSTPDPSKMGSTKVPSMLYDNLDFDNLKGNDKVCKRRKYSLTTLRAEMEKFYNESWGGEEFNHREIQKYMSRDKNLWVIDPKDKVPGLAKRRSTCHHCDRPGHRDDMCRLRTPVCYMCGSTGHYEPRCPAKICVNCGSPNHMYSSMCRNCSTWYRITCRECGQVGHPASHCPDLWRRYHNTIDGNLPLEENRQCKKLNQQYCSGCTRRGHLVHTCRITLPFSAMPINSPYVSVYRPYLPALDSYSSETMMDVQEERINKQAPRNQSQETTFSLQNNISKNSRNKRQSKSPCLYESQKEFKKKKHNSVSETIESNQINVSTGNRNGNSRKFSTSKDDSEIANKVVNVEKALDFIPLSSNNHDKKGHMIQDNEVSDTSNVVTFARIYVTNDVLDKLKQVDGQEWLTRTMDKLNVHVQNSNVTSYLAIRGNVADQESFQTELRDWLAITSNSNRNANNEVSAEERQFNLALNLIPKNRKQVLKVIGQALDSLNDNLGEPNDLYKRFTILQKQHKLLLKQKVINPDKLANSTDSMKRILKKLNMVLLGQAGLANGQKSLNKLYSLQQRLIQLNERTLTVNLRKEIAHHYKSIFLAIERNDYSELLQKYHNKNVTTKVTANKQENSKSDLGQNKRENDSINNTNPPPSPNPIIQESKIQQNPNPVTDSNSFNKVPRVTLAMLVSYRQKLQKAHPKSKNRKVLRLNLVRRLHVLISYVSRKEQINAKTAKKMKRVQSDARQFLLTNL